MCSVEVFVCSKEQEGQVKVGMRGVSLGRFDPPPGAKTEANLDNQGSRVTLVLAQTVANLAPTRVKGPRPTALRAFCPGSRRANLGRGSPSALAPDEGRG